MVYSQVPGPGTAPDSPDACYISQHWLSLRNVMANPGMASCHTSISFASNYHDIIHYSGPISQYEFACRHGGKAVVSECVWL